MKATNWMLALVLSLIALVAAEVAKADTLSVVSSSISNGELFAPAPLPFDLTETVTFSSPVDESSLSFTLLDPNSHAVAPQSFVFDITGTVLTTNWQLGLSGTYLFVLPTTIKNSLDTASLNPQFEVIFSLNNTSPVPVLPTPEPSLLLLTATGLLPLALRLKRRTNRQKSLT